MCNELRNRDVEDILITCRDNLSGFSAAIEAAFPKTEQQLCIIHQIRNSTKYVSYKDLKPVMADLRAIYQALSEDDALYHLEEFKEKWNGKYPQIGKSWEDNWVALATFFKFPAEVRRLIYTTNAVEGFPCASPPAKWPKASFAPRNRWGMLRKYTKNKTAFPSDDSLKKSIFLSIQEIAKKWSMPVRDWKHMYPCIQKANARQELWGR